MKKQEVQFVEPVVENKGLLRSYLWKNPGEIITKQDLDGIVSDLQTKSKGDITKLTPREFAVCRRAMLAQAIMKIQAKKEADTAFTIRYKAYSVGTTPYRE